MPVNHSQFSVVEFKVRRSDGSFRVIPQEDISRAVVGNSATSAGGNFSVSLKTNSTEDNDDYLQVIHPNDFVEVSLANGVEVLEPQLEIVGLVDRVNRNRSASSTGSTLREWEISGRDAVGKILTATDRKSVV